MPKRMRESFQQQIARLMGQAINAAQEFDMWLLSMWGQPPNPCHCGRTYKKEGWLLRHYRRTGHWERENG